MNGRCRAGLFPSATLSTTTTKVRMRLSVASHAIQPGRPARAAANSRMKESLSSSGGRSSASSGCGGGAGGGAVGGGLSSTTVTRGGVSSLSGPNTK